jgi:hypothetical protein
MSCKCQDCGVSYQVDILIPDELWKELTGKSDGSGLLCGGCIISRIEALGYSAWRLVRE